MEVADGQLSLEKANAPEIRKDLKVDQCGALERDFGKSGGEMKRVAIEHVDGGGVLEFFHVRPTLIEKHLGVVVCEEKMIQQRQRHWPVQPREMAAGIRSE